MTNKEKEQIITVLEFLQKNNSIKEYKIDTQKNIIFVSTDIKDERELEFLEFKIVMSAAVINEEFEDTLNVEFMD